MTAAARQRLATQVALRAGAALLLTGLAATAAAGATALVTPGRTALAALALVAVAGAQRATLGAVVRRPWIADGHFVLDVAYVSWLVAATGGIASVLVPLYALPVIAAATVLSYRGALQVAALSSLVFGGLVLTQYSAAAGLLDAPWLPASDAGTLPLSAAAQVRVTSTVFAFFAVALLAGQIGEGLRRADARLAAASERIADLEAFNRRVIDHLATGLATADAEGRVLTCNHAALAITGATDAVGRPAGEWLQLPEAWPSAAPGDAVQSVDRPHTRARRADYRYRRADGRDIDLGLTAAVLPLPEGGQGTIYTFQDVTDVRQLEQTAQARERLALIGEMAAGIAHEIRNPLAAMSGSIQVLQQELVLAPEQARLLDIVLRESDRLNQTISTLLTYAAPPPAATRQLDLRQVVEDAAALLRHSAERLEAHAIAVDVPDEPVWMDGDESQLRQVLWNLATNAIKAMPEGGRLRLFAAVDAAHEEVRLGAEDTGVGMSADEVATMFLPFRGRFRRGSGLGLAIVQRIVTDYNGRIDVQSAEGRGTTVTVRFRAAAERSPRA